MMKSKAWSILSEDEKLALTLSINHKKSTWEAGEIMDKSHYKYLEIKARAEFFFKRFTQYFNKTGNLLIPANTQIPLDLREFLHYTIEDRKGYRESLNLLGKSKIAIGNSKQRADVLKGYLQILLDSKDELQIDLYDLIFDFDRWNNFRILPDSLQEPSAFKRRNKTRLIKHLKNLNNIDEFNLKRFTTKFVYNKKSGKKLYMPIVSEFFSEGYKIIPIQRKRDLVTYFSTEFQLYIFSDRDIAIEYCNIVSSYLSLKRKNCREGQRFWPRFRNLIEKSYNYNEVNNIIPRRKNLDNAFREIDFGKRVIEKPSKELFKL